MNDRAEEQYNRITQILQVWREQTQHTYEEKQILSPTQITTEGEMIVLLANKVTLIHVEKTVISDESGPFKHNIYGDAGFEDKLHEFIKNFDEGFYNKVAEKQDERDGDEGGFIG